MSSGYVLIKNVIINQVSMSFFGQENKLRLKYNHCNSLLKD